ncbi:MAG: hypothetical protein NTV15_01395 [Candidatus Bathyarchaeota archaeon]|nr:hypothetical protein [Candidatus Bathyarchaeota archaeon]
MDIRYKIAILTLTTLALGVLSAGYLGFVPGVSDVMGTNKPIDLGVDNTAKDLSSIKQKLSQLYTASKPTQIQLTSNELTALLVDQAEKSESIPLLQPQVKVTETGVQVSGILDVEKFRKITETSNISSSLKSQLETTVNLVKTNPSIYLDLSLTIQDGELQSMINLAKIGQISIPLEQLKSNTGILTEEMKQALEASGIKIQNLKTVDGKIDIQSYTKLIP